MLKKDPRERPTINEAMYDDWIQKYAKLERAKIEKDRKLEGALFNWGDIIYYFFISLGILENIMINIFEQDAEQVFRFWVLVLVSPSTTLG